MRGARLVVPVVAVAVSALVVTACGDDTSDEPGALSKSEFAKQANELCTKARADRAEQLRQVSARPSGSADAQKLTSVASTDRELVRRVDALVPPQAEQDQVDRVLDGWRQRAGLEDHYASAVESMQDTTTLASFTANIAQIDAVTDPVAVQLGLTACTRGTPTTPSSP
jgi:hypothetical protein